MYESGGHTHLNHCSVACWDAQQEKNDEELELVPFGGDIPVRLNEEVAPRAGPRSTLIALFALSLVLPPSPGLAHTLPVIFPLLTLVRAHSCGLGSEHPHPCTGVMY